MESLSDEELVARSKLEGLDGVRQSVFLDELFSRYHSRVALWCYRVTRDREAASDLAQEVFLRAYRSWPLFRGDAKFSTWLYTITRNQCLSHLQSRAVRPEHTAEPLDFDLLDQASRVDNAMELQSEVRQMQQLLASTLDSTERTVFTLHFGDEMPLDTIGKLLNLTNVSGAKAYIVSAKRKLKAALARTRATEARRSNL